MIRNFRLSQVIAPAAGDAAGSALPVVVFSNLSIIIKRVSFQVYVSTIATPFYRIGNYARLEIRANDTTGMSDGIATKNSTLGTAFVLSDSVIVTGNPWLAPIYTDCEMSFNANKDFLITWNIVCAGMLVTDVVVMVLDVLGDV